MEMFKGKIYGNVISQPELPLMSCIIVSYNNVNLLYDSVKSFLGQEYGNYEIVISDDASAKFTLQDIGKQVCKAAFDLMFEQENGSLADKDKQFEEWTDKCNDFLAAALLIVKEYFPKIKKIVIRKNEENLGTVKHLIQAKKEISGKYLMFMAADDKLHDSMVMADMINYFEKLPEDVFALASQCAMCDDKLNKMFSYFVTDEVKDLINNGTPEQVFGELTVKCILPAAGTIYKTKIFEVFGDFDDEYHLVEDWTYFLKITRQGCKIAYYDRLSYLHRDGGISHGNSVGGSIARRYYFEDCIHAWHKEIFPYMEKLNLKQRKASLHEYKYHIETYENIFLEIEATNNIPKIEPVQIFNIGAVCLVVSFLISCLKISSPNISFLYYLFGILGMVLFCFSFFMEIFILSSACLKKIVSMFFKGRKIE